MLILSIGDACPEPLRLAVDEARCFSDVFETVRPLSYHSDCFVTLVRCRATGFKTVVKAYIRDQMGTNSQNQVALEARIHGGLDHPHVIPLLLAFEDSQHVYLAVQHADGGDLRKHLQERPMPEERVRSWLAPALLQAMAQVHEQGIIHRDIKPENVLLRDGAPVLADFGMSAYSRHPDGQDAADRSPLTAGGTPLYTAPEVILAMFKNACVHDVVGPKNDIWALGLVFLEALTGSHPFSPEQAADGNVLYTIANCSKVNLPTRLSPLCQSFLAAALARDPATRLDAPALLQHEWLTGGQEVGKSAGVAAAVAAAAAPSCYSNCTTAMGRAFYESEQRAMVACKQLESWEY